MRKLLISAILIIVGVLLPFSATAASNVKNVNVAIFPELAGQATQYTIGFNVSSTGALKGGRDEIFIIFPDGSKLPEKISDDEILLNGYAVDTRTIYIDGTTLTFEVPSDVNISNNSYVGIIIKKTADIRTPNRSGSYPISIKTTYDSLNFSNKISLTGKSVTSCSVSLSPAAVNDYAEYQVNFRTSSSGQLTGNQDYIYLEFPKDVDLPRTIDGELVEINDKTLDGATIDVDRDDNRIAIRLPAGLNISSRRDVELIISEEARIRNPRYIGKYDLNVYTSKDTLGSEAEFTIGMTITKPMVVVSPNQEGVTGQYTIGFTTSTNGSLDGGADYIIIKFPDATSVPSSITASSVTVNGHNASLISVIRSERKISIRLPQALDIAENSYVNVVIKGEAQIRNPGNAGYYTVEISTTTDKSATKSNEYVILGDSISRPNVRLSTYQVDQYPDVKIDFEISSVGGLIGGRDTVAIEFPSAFELPSYIDEEEITINGKIAEKISVSGRVVTITLPSDLDLESGDDVEIEISRDAQVKNPSKKGNYSLEVSTSKDIKATDSRNFAIGDNSSEISQKPIVELTDYTPGSSSQYLIAFYNEQWVLEEDDVIELTFPQDAALPDSISRSLVHVNGTTAEDVDIYSNEMSITLPDDVDIDYQEKVIILIEASAGIKNPSVSGDYTIEVDQGGGLIQESVPYSIAGSQPTGKRIVFRVGSTLAQSNDQFITLQAAPTIIGQSTMVPLRSLGDALGATTSYDAATSIINVQYEGKTIIFVIGSKLAQVNSQWMAIDEAPTIINDRTMIPVRFVSESFGAMVEWDATTSEITITQ